MSLRITIREEGPGDFAAIFGVVSAAFERDDEARLVDRLRAGGFVRLSQVALLDGQIVGHVLWSDLAIVDGDQRASALALAPVAVVPKLQSRGIGSQLIRAGLAVLRKRGHRIAIVLGHQHYYPRFGFSAELARSLDSPYAGDSFMALELVPGALAGIRGRVEYPPPFSEA